MILFLTFSCLFERAKRSTAAEQVSFSSFLTCKYFFRLDQPGNAHSTYKLYRPNAITLNQRLARCESFRTRWPFVYLVPFRHNLVLCQNQPVTLRNLLWVARMHRVEIRIIIDYGTMNLRCLKE